MSPIYRVLEHIIPGQHIRHNHHATLETDEDVLKVAIKQYTPLDNLSPSAGDITIIAAHANGFPKELYEPLFDELYHFGKRAGFSIRSIWIADVAFQGTSSVLNEQRLGNDPSWFDHSLDLLTMINHFRLEIKKPIFGIGHSMGAGQLTKLSLLHPNLFESMVLIEPVIDLLGSPRNVVSLATMSALRRDQWPSRKDAAQSFKQSKFYQSWNPRVFDLWIEYGLRDLPTKIYPDNTDGKAVTLTTPKHQEVFTFVRPLDNSLKASLKDFTEEEKNQLTAVTHPDLSNLWGPDWDFYRPEGYLLLTNLLFVRPSVLYIFGGASELSLPKARKVKMETTGTGLGGSGGAKAGKVKEIVMRDAGHLIPMEHVQETAQYCADWINSELKVYKKKKELLQRFRDATPEKERYTLSTMILSNYKKDLETAKNARRKVAQQAKPKL